KQTLALAKEINNKQEIIGALNSMGIHFTEKGDYDHALDYLEQSLSICYEIHSFKTIIVLNSLFELYFYTNSLEKAQKCLESMKQFIREHIEYKTSHTFYHLAKAIMLKKKPQKISHLKAKEILRQIIDEESPFSGLYYPALIHLCDTCLTILSETNDLKTLDEIQPYLTQLKFIAKSQKSFWLLVEVYSLQAKLKLITFEFKEAQRILSQALDIAKNYGLNLLAERISMEQDKLVNEKSKWEALRKSKALMAERIELAHLNDQIVRMLRKRVYLKKA
ncbi:MAG: tetratricopeptide repeat protein, partial [Promethearchaeota archaeon]